MVEYVRIYLEGTGAAVLAITMGYDASGVSITREATEKARGQ